MIADAHATKAQSHSHRRELFIQHGGSVHSCRLPRHLNAQDCISRDRVGSRDFEAA